MTKSHTSDLTSGLTESLLREACERLKSGDVVGMPTETVYGLAASIESDTGLRRIFSLKERPFFDPLIVHVASLAEAQSLVSRWPKLAGFLAERFWPGPLTMVLPKAEHVNPIITSGLETVAVRFPNHPVMLEVIRTLGTPLAAPSANKFGRTSPSRSEHVRSEFPEILVLEGGASQIGVESTVVTLVDDDQTIAILRPGGVTAEQLREALTDWETPVQVRRAQSEASPGHLKHHYMPSVPLVIVAESEPEGLSAEALANVQSELKLGKIERVRELSLDRDPSVAARELYSEMRRLDQLGADLLYVRMNPEASVGLWQAIWDRLTRAASLSLVE